MVKEISGRKLGKENAKENACCMHISNREQDKAISSKDCVRKRVSVCLSVSGGGRNECVSVCVCVCTPEPES